jgi:thiamine-monophosphate kinase
MAKASGVGFNVDEEKIPMEPGLDLEERERALHWGGDFELLFTVKPEMMGDLKIDGITVIGTVTANKEIILSRNGKIEPLPDKGYEHFGRGTW